MFKNNHPAVIKIFLPSGDPTAIRIAEISSIILCAIEVPRLQLNNFFDLPESRKAALYCLLGEDENGKQQVYIGQTSRLKKRLKSHNEQKDFWNKAIIFVSSTNKMTKAHMLYLESVIIEKVIQANRYKIENNKSGLKQHMPRELQAECDVCFDEIEVLSETLGFPLFKPINSSSGALKNNDQESLLFYCKRNGSNGKGVYNNEGFIVLQGSIVSSKPSNTFSKSYYAKRREKLMIDNIIVERDKKLIFSEDYLFDSVSAASAVLIGTSSNGWEVWKDSEDRTLDLIVRQGASSVT